MKKTILLTMILAAWACMASAATDPTSTAPAITQSPNGQLMANGTTVDTSPALTGSNVYKYNGAPTTVDVPLDIHGVSAVATIQSNGKYTMAFYADPEGGAIYCGEQDGGMMTEAISKMHNYAPSRGYRYEYYLGNLYGAQRKKMPQGELDQANKRVVFKDVELKPGEKDVRVNLVVKIFAPDGTKLKAPDPNGFYGWTTDDPDKSVVGTKDNGWLFDVLSDGTIQGRGLDLRKPS